MGVFDAPDGMPRIEHAIVDEETVMQRYLADVAMEDILLSPPMSARRVRPGSLLAQYRQDVAERQVQETTFSAPREQPVETITLIVPWTGKPTEFTVKDDREATEFKGK